MDGPVGKPVEKSRLRRLQRPLLAEEIGLGLAHALSLDRLVGRDIIAAKMLVQVMPEQE